MKQTLGRSEGLESESRLVQVKSAYNEQGDGVAGIRVGDKGVGGTEFGNLLARPVPSPRFSMLTRHMSVFVYAL